MVGLKGRKILVIIDETGNKKKGKSRDYVSRQDLGKLGKINNGIVVVTAWGLIEQITPLIFEIDKPQQPLKAGDVYQANTNIAAGLIRQINQMGCEIELVLAESLYRESETTFSGCLEELKLNFIGAISNHGVGLTKEQKVRQKK